MTGIIISGSWHTKWQVFTRGGVWCTDTIIQMFAACVMCPIHIACQSFIVAMTPPQLLGAFPCYSLDFFWWNNSEDLFPLINTMTCLLYRRLHTYGRQPFILLYILVHLTVCLRSCKCQTESCTADACTYATPTQRKLVFLCIALCMKHSNHIPSSAQVHELACRRLLCVIEFSG